MRYIAFYHVMSQVSSELGGQIEEHIVGSLWSKLSNSRNSKLSKNRFKHLLSQNVILPQACAKITNSAQETLNKISASIPVKL